MNFKRMTLGLALCTLSLWGAKTAYFALTDGFSVANITSEHADNPELAIAVLTDVEAAEVNQALSQEFSYLAKGHHSYVFESADKNYVIKFLKFQKYRHHPLVSYLPLPTLLDKNHLKRTVHKEKKRDVLLKSWKTAFTRLKEQTQLIYVHLNRTEPLGKTLTVRNKCGLTYRLDLDHYVFMLQKKVDLLPEALTKLVSKGDMPSAKKVLDNLLNLYSFEFEQGLFEDDRCVVRNTGVLNHVPVHLDIDRFREDDRLRDPTQQSLHLQWKTTHLVKWLEDRYPELAEHFKESLKEKHNV